MHDDADDELEFQAFKQAAGKPSAAAKQRSREPFVMVPLWWIEGAAKATKSPAALVLIELLRLRWRTKRLTFPLPNIRLQKLGVSRDVKRRVLRDLERANFIAVERRLRKSPLVTLVVL